MTHGNTYIIKIVQCTLGVKIRKLKVDFKTGGRWAMNNDNEYL